MKSPPRNGRGPDPGFPIDTHPTFRERFRTRIHRLGKDLGQITDRQSRSFTDLKQDPTHADLGADAESLGLKGVPIQQSRIGRPFERTEDEKRAIPLDQSLTRGHRRVSQQNAPDLLGFIQSAPNENLVTIQGESRPRILTFKRKQFQNRS